MPKDYKRVLSAASAAEREGRDVNEAVMARWLGAQGKQRTGEEYWRWVTPRDS